MLPSVKPDIFEKYQKEINKLGQNLNLPTLEERHSTEFKEWQGGGKTLSWDELSSGQKVYEQIVLEQNSRTVQESRDRIRKLQRCIYPDD